MRIGMWGAVLVAAVFGYGASCVGDGPLDESSDPGLRETPADDLIDDDGSGDDGEEQPVTDDHPTVRDAGAVDDHPRATLTSGLDLTTLRSEVIREDGSIEDIGDDELFLYPENRARIFITVSNQSDGWAPINFELCTDNHEAITVIDAEAVSGPNGAPDPEYDEDIELAREACRVRFAPGEWPTIEAATDAEFLTGAVTAYPHPAGGYLTIRFRAEFVELGEMDLYEYTVPYRVLPGGQTKAMFIPRRATLRRLVMDLR